MTKKGGPKTAPLFMSEQYWLLPVANPVASSSDAILPAFVYLFQRNILTSVAETVVRLTDCAVAELVAVAKLVVAVIRVLSARR